MRRIEESFGLERLYQLCEVARELVNPYHVGRVIAGRFWGHQEIIYRTANRHDYGVPPPEPTAG